MFQGRDICFLWSKEKGIDRGGLQKLNPRCFATIDLRVSKSNRRPGIDDWPELQCRVTGGVKGDKGPFSRERKERAKSIKGIEKNTVGRLACQPRPVATAVTILMWRHFLRLSSPSFGAQGRDSNRVWPLHPPPPSFVSTFENICASSKFIPICLIFKDDYRSKIIISAEI